MAEIRARDGLSLPSYLTVPVGAAKKSLPLVLYVHGGPWTRDTWGYDGDVQWLANRGYAVSSIDWPNTPHPPTVEFAGADLDNGLPALTGPFGQP